MARCDYQSLSVASLPSLLVVNNMRTWGCQLNTTKTVNKDYLKYFFGVNWLELREIEERFP